MMLFFVGVRDKHLGMISAESWLRRPVALPVFHTESGCASLFSVSARAKVAISPRFFGGIMRHLFPTGPRPWSVWFDHAEQGSRILDTSARMMDQWHVNILIGSSVGGRTHYKPGVWKKKSPVGLALAHARIGISCQNVLHEALRSWELTKFRVHVRAKPIPPKKTNTTHEVHQIRVVHSDKAVPSKTTLKMEYRLLVSTSMKTNSQTTNYLLKHVKNHQPE